MTAPPHSAPGAAIASADVAVVGGGVIGLSAAERLSAMGQSVVIIERDEIAAGASAGNAAGFGFSEIAPLATSQNILQAAKWLLRPNAPFAVAPRDFLPSLPWLARFLRAAAPAAAEKSAATLAALMRLEQQTLPRMLARAGMRDMLRQTGALHLHRSRRAFRADARKWKGRMLRHGVECEFLQDDELHRFQPGLSPRIVAGVYCPNYFAVSDPKDYCLALHRAVRARGARTIYREVANIAPTGDGAILTDAAAATIAIARRVVLAAGPWSPALARKLGSPVPVIGERGYNTTLPKSAFPELARSLFLSWEGFIISPLADGVRVGGASEIAALHRRPNFLRARAMLRTAREHVPALKGGDGAEWRGFRPTSPDSLPVIGPCRLAPNVCCAFGHGHAGLTLSTSTAQLVAEIVNGERPSADIAPLSPGRF